MAKAITGFRYGDYGRAERADVRRGRPRPLEEKEVLTGMVRGLPASDLEERFARALNRRRIPYEFQFEFYTPNKLQENKVDFVIRGVQPVEIDGFIGHYFNIGRKAETTTRDLFVNETLSRMGMRPVIHIPYFRLENQDMADRAPVEFRVG